MGKVRSEASRCILNLLSHSEDEEMRQICHSRGGGLIDRRWSAEAES